MRRSLVTAALLVLFSAGYAESFYIKDYNIDVKINKDSSFHVKEEIIVHFLEPRHGIFRFIPYLYHINREAGSDQRQFPVLLGDRFEALLYGVKVPGYEKKISRQNGYLNIKIGSKDRTVEGDQEYKIEYNLYGEIGTFQGHSEFYFNLIGDKWEVPIMSVTFRVELPGPVALGDRDVAFYTGTAGSTGSDVDSQFRDERVISGIVTRQLEPYEGVTIAVRLPANYFVKNGFLDAWLWLANNFYLFLPLLVLLIAFLTWFYKGRDKKVVEMVHFEPPENVTPAEAGVIIDDVTDNRDLLSLIFYWAANGIIEIEENDNYAGISKQKEYVLIRKKDLPKNSQQFEKTMFNGLFNHFAQGGKVEISSLKESFYTYFNQAKSELDAYIDLQSYYEPGSRGLKALFLFLAAAFPILGFALFIAMDMGVWVFLSFLACAPFWFGFGWFMPKKTAKGLDQYRILKGFKLFIDRAEKPKLEALFKEDPKYFDRTLSYAIALGSGDKWARKFNDIIKEPPSWYRGTGMAHFSTLYFLGSLNHTMSTMSSAMTSMPSRSSSGGFGGGGFSGGGGGGGGGGSW